MSDDKLRALPREVPDYHARQAAHLRALGAHIIRNISGRGWCQLSIARLGISAPTGQRIKPLRISAKASAWLAFQVGAVEKTRTSTEFPPQRPQRCASTNSATTARVNG